MMAGSGPVGVMSTEANRFGSSGAPPEVRIRSGRAPSICSAEV